MVTNILLLPDLLLSELKSDKKDLLQLLVLIEEYVFSEQSIKHNDQGTNVLSDTSLDSLETIIEQCQAVISEIESPLEQVEVLLNELFYQHLFIDNPLKHHWPLDSFKVAVSLNQRLMSPIVKAAMVSEIIKACHFDNDLVFLSGKVMISVNCHDDYAIIFDAVSGESLDWHDLDLSLSDLEGDPSQHQVKAMERSALLVEHISALKNALIKEQVYDKALLCVDLLLSMNPDDPLQRRDRGFLLHQLACFKVAVDDYRYFVEHCPDDPAAQLLKIQLEHISLSETVLH